MSLINVCFAASIESDDFYEFTMPWNDNVNNIITTLNSDTVEVASPHGLLRAVGEKLIFEDGTVASLWGMAITVSKNFPPKDKQDSRVVVKKLLKYGFNFVRINGLDFPNYGLYKNWLKNGKLDKDVMDRLDFFVSELTKSGIYYSLSINNSSLKADGISDVQTNGHAVKHKKFKFVQLYDERVKEKVFLWHRDFYSHKNHYTGLTYARDPANVFVTAIGEDSIFNGYFNYRHKFLTERNLKDLEIKFNSYLSSQYKSTSHLRSSWQGELGSGELLEKHTIKLTSADQLGKINKLKSRDIIRFLSDIDFSYAEKIKYILRDIGYRGLFAGTNDWYGYANLKVNKDFGDFIDMHGYFDPMVRIKYQGKYTELTRNTSHISSPANNSNGADLVDDFSRNFYKFFLSAVDEKPLMITEWNHSAWSDYSYEGPLLLTAYSMLQGYSSTVVHSYFSMGLNYKAEYANNSLVASGNPVLMSLSPSLSLAFRKSYIKESSSNKLIVIANNDEALLDATVSDRLNKLKRRAQPEHNFGFIKKIRMQLIGKNQQSTNNHALSGNKWLSDTGQIEWHFADKSTAYITVNTPKFQFAAGQLNNVDAPLDDVSVSLENHGAVTAISLDDVDIEQSSSILITAVSSFKNTAMKTAVVSKFRKWRDLVQVIDHGSAPILMRRVLGKFNLISSNDSIVEVRAVMPDGSYEKVKSTVKMLANNRQNISFSLGEHNTPWYWVSFNKKNVH